MQLTKYEHACFTVEKDEAVLVVDPGEWSTNFEVPDHVVGIVVTHEHPDHYDPSTVAAILDKNPEAILIGDASVVAEAPSSQPVSAGEQLSVGPFELEFFGGEHAIIHPSIPPIANLGVLINETIYYPGDSFALPNKTVDILAVPAAAPWMKFSEAADFLEAVKAHMAFPTHDAILSPTGQKLADAMLGGFAQKAGTEYRRIHGETISI